ncbi:MAG: hypothetical protein GX774_19480 [Armatimonadetes bacterium]|nr:hypothetical protein [Armatimonadota bacterium]
MLPVPPSSLALAHGKSRPARGVPIATAADAPTARLAATRFSLFAAGACAPGARLL